MRASHGCSVSGLPSLPDMLLLVFFRRGRKQHLCEECHVHVGQERTSDAKWVSQDVERATRLWSNVGLTSSHALAL